MSNHINALIVSNDSVRIKREGLMKRMFIIVVVLIYARKMDVPEFSRPSKPLKFIKKMPTRQNKREKKV